MKKVFVLGLVFFTVCLWQFMPQAQAGGEAALKVGWCHMDSPLGESSKNKVRVEGEWAPFRFFDDHLDVFGAVSWSPVDSSGELQTTSGQIAEISINVLDCSLGMHYYPFPKLCNGVLNPYIGGGAAYYWSTTTKTGAGKQVGSGAGYTLHEKVEENKTISNAAFPFIVGGLRIRLGKEAQEFPFLLVEGRYDFNKKDKGYDYTGATASAGLGYQW
jgi:outer membrane protein W